MVDQLAAQKDVKMAERREICLVLAKVVMWVGTRVLKMAESWAAMMGAWTACVRVES